LKKGQKRRNSRGESALKKKTSFQPKEQMPAKQARLRKGVQKELGQTNQVLILKAIFGRTETW